MFSSKKIFMAGGVEQDDCPRRIIPIGTCRVFDADGNVMGFTINWRVSDDTREGKNGTYQYVWQPCAPVELGGCSAPYEIVDGQPTQNWTFESPAPNPDGSFSKTITFSKEARPEGVAYGQQELFNYANRVELAAGSPQSGSNTEDFGECTIAQITVNC